MLTAETEEVKGPDVDRVEGEALDVAAQHRRPLRLQVIDRRWIIAREDLLRLGQRLS